MHPLTRNQRYGQFQPQMGQMGDFFSNLLDNAEKAFEKGITKAQNDFLTEQVQAITNDPVIRQAAIDTGNDAAIQRLAQQLKAAQTSTLSAVKNNPYTTMAIGGGVLLLVGIGLIFILKR